MKCTVVLLFSLENTSADFSSNISFQKVKKKRVGACLKIETAVQYMGKEEEFKT